MCIRDRPEVVEQPTIQADKGIIIYSDSVTITWDNGGNFGCRVSGKGIDTDVLPPYPRTGSQSVLLEGVSETFTISCPNIGSDTVKVHVVHLYSD